jgi:hypothetical protein
MRKIDLVAALSVPVPGFYPVCAEEQDRRPAEGFN